LYNSLLNNITHSYKSTLIQLSHEKMFLELA
jgi:hypothetical protein